MKKFALLALCLAFVSTGARAQTKPDVSGTWNITLGDWSSDNGTQVNMTGMVSGIVIRVQGDSITANTRGANGTIGKDTLRGVWADGKFKLSRAMTLKHQTRDETGTVTSEDDNGTAQLIIELAPEAEQLKGTIKIASPEHVLTAPLTATRVPAGAADSHAPGRADQAAANRLSPFREAQDSGYIAGLE